MKKFWVVHNIPAPYRLHTFNALWRECRRRGLEFHVHFMSDMSRGYDERPVSWRNPKMNFPHTYWRDLGIGQRHVNPGLLWHLWKSRPEYLLAGSPFDTLTGMLAGRMVKGLACTWCEGNTKTSGKMGGLIGWVKRFALAGFKYVAVPGGDAAKYIALHQARIKKTMPTPVMLPNLVDETRFRPREKWPEGEIAALRTQLGVAADERLIITPARLLPVKGLVPYINLLTPEMMEGWKQVIIGNGPLKGQILETIAQRGLKGRISIIETVAYFDMPKYYAAADLMLLPSVYDPNPLSVVEALHSGLPIALTSEAGNVEEAVTEGKNGWVLPVKEAVRFGGVLREVFSSGFDRLRLMGKISLEENAKFWTTDVAVGDFLEAIVGVGAMSDGR